jgi:hypothetical protein
MIIYTVKAFCRKSFSKPKTTAFLEDQTERQKSRISQKFQQHLPGSSVAPAEIAESSWGVEESTF